MSTPKNYDKPNAPDQGGEEGKPAPAQHPELVGAKGQNEAPAGEPNPAAIQPTPADPRGPVPRVVKPEERAPSREFVRYKISCRNYAEVGTFRTLYILGRTGDQGEAEARDCYLKSVGLDKTLERFQKNKAANMRAAHLAAGKKGDPDIDPIDPPDLSVKQLAD